MDIMGEMIAFVGGATGYWLIESSWRYVTNRGFYTHPIMALIGGIAVLSMYCLEKRTSIHIIIKALLAALFITMMEFIVGYVYTYILDTPLWTYGTLDFMGIISLSWSGLWWLLSFVCIWIIRLLNRRVKDGKKENSTN